MPHLRWTSSSWTGSRLPTRPKGSRRTREILKLLSQEVPIVPLFGQDDTAAISSKLTFSGINQYVLSGLYPLDIHPK